MHISVTLVVQNFEARDHTHFASAWNSEITLIKELYPNYTRQSFLNSEPICHYVRYYKKFKKTFHVLHQLESVLLKKKPLPDTHPLVQALFLTELINLQLIACHDLDTINQPLTIGVSKGGEEYIGSTGKKIKLYPNDTYMKEGDEVIVSIIYGQDARTRITEHTKNALFLIDGVEGITREEIMKGLTDILRFLQLFSLKVEVSYMKVLPEE